MANSLRESAGRTVTVRTQFAPYMFSDEHQPFGRALVLPRGVTPGLLETVEDINYYRINILYPGTLTVYTTGTPDTIGCLYDSAGREIASNEDGGEDANFRIEVEVGAGTYYVSVVGHGPTRRIHSQLRGPYGGLGYYKIHANYPVASDSPSTTDLVLPLNGSRDGRIDLPGVFTYYRVDVPRPTTIELTIHASLLEAALYDSTEELLATTRRYTDASTDGYGSFTLAVAAGTYYVGVKSHGRDIGSEYTVQLDAVEQLGEDELDDAVELTLGQNFSSTTEDVPARTIIKHYYRLGISQPGLLTVSVPAAARNDFLAGRNGWILSTKVSLYDNSGNHIAGDTRHKDEKFPRVVTKVDAGTYYVSLETDEYRHLGSGGFDYTYSIQTHLGTALSLPLGVSAQNDDTEAPVNLYRLNVEQSGWLVIENLEPTSVPASLFDSEGNRIHARNIGLIRSRANGVAWQSIRRLEAQIKAGTYFVAVDGTSQFAVKAHFPFIDGDAIHVALGSSHAARVDGLGDIDYYRIDLDSPGRLVVFTTGGIDTEGRLFDSAGNLLDLEESSLAGRTGRSFHHGENFRIEWFGDAGTYYVSVAFGRSRSGSYVVHANGTGNSTDLTFGKGETGHSVDLQYYRISVAQPGRLTLYTTDARDRHLNFFRVYDYRGREAAIDYLAHDIGYFGREGEQTTDGVKWEVEPGTYFASVERAYSQDGGIWRPGPVVEEGAPYSIRAILNPVRLELGASSGGLITARTSDRYHIDLLRPDWLRVELTRDRAPSPSTHFVDAGAYYWTVTAGASGNTNNGLIPYTIHTTGASDLALHANQAGNFAVEGGVDYYRIEIERPGTLLIYTSGRLSTLGAVYDDDTRYYRKSYNDALYRSQSGGEGENFRIEEQVDPGTYFISVGSQQSGDYIVHTDFVEGSRFDHGDGFADATYLSLGDTLHGGIFPLGLDCKANTRNFLPGLEGCREEHDQDYFRIGFTGPGLLAVHYAADFSSQRYCSATGPAARRFLTLVSQVGNEPIDPWHIEQGERRCLFTFLVGTGAHYVVMGQGGHGGPAEYTIRADAAHDLLLGQESSGHIEHSGDIDYYRFEITRADTLVVNTIRTQAYPLRVVEATLYDITGTKLFGPSATVPPDGESIEWKLDAGTYYLAIGSYAGYTGDYGIHARLASDDGSDEGGDSEGGGDDGDDECFEEGRGVAAAAIDLNVGDSHSSTIDKDCRLVLDLAGRELGGDSYRVSIDRPATLTFYTTDATANMRLYFNNESEEFLHGVTTLVWRDVVPSVRGFREVTAGTYYVIADAQNGTDYTLHVGVSSDLYVNQTHDGSIAFEGEVHYFRLSINQSGTLFLYTSGEITQEGIGVLLYNQGGVTVSLSNDGGWEVEAGTYYVSVDALYGSTGSYSIYPSLE